MECRHLKPGDGAIAANAVNAVKPRAERRCGEVGVEVMEGFLARPGNLLIVAVDKGHPVGYVVAYEIPRIDGGAPMMLVYEVDVLAAMRRQGIGTSMMRRLEEEARRRGIGAMWVLTDDGNPAALALYGAAGATRVEPPQVVFRWTLSRTVASRGREP